MNFEKALEHVLKWEGGLSDHPADRGGRTKYGITLPTLQRAKELRIVGHTDIYRLTLQEAKDIYYNLYWEACRCDALPFPVALVLFDTAVNQGVNFAVRALQEVVGTEVDGIIGRRTLEKVESVDVRELVNRLTQRRIKRYVDIVKNSPSQMVYLYGWLRRAVDTLVEALRWSNG